jgi:hypothetical protein
MKKYLAIVLGVMLFTTIIDYADNEVLVMEDKKWGYYSDYCNQGYMITLKGEDQTRHIWIPEYCSI